MLRRRRDTDGGFLCRTALTDWLQMHGKQTYYDRLSHALQQIGRTDIAIEVGKNINQDKTLSMQHYVDDYSQHVNKMASAFEMKPEREKQMGSNKLRSIRQLRDLVWKDLDLVIEIESMPPYPWKMLDVMWPVVFGIFLGFAGAFLLFMPVLFFATCVCHSDRNYVAFPR
ncbi:transmembrane and death domain protein 1 isoform X2 [Denticeps clupeoides]|uniref:transmembrane and death domain protein 1 isoform X2 n=1 Tax=Denticeps clupeoides TaxID=299321 RepID=UPI0010A3B2E2|nr:uncharacterized protein C12orf81-like isoform X2 [Denticeps clupeoides]